ncbi:hypothetical protein C8R44DRAFT_798761 [Mycena epipterygia]|nr:hypothetical protein C8R44DRAFT_798761 [Mycena epipterygia]
MSPPAAQSRTSASGSQTRAHGSTFPKLHSIGTELKEISPLIAYPPAALPSLLQWALEWAAIREIEPKT